MTCLQTTLTPKGLPSSTGSRLVTKKAFYTFLQEDFRDVNYSSRSGDSWAFNQLQKVSVSTKIASSAFLPKRSLLNRSTSASGECQSSFPSTCGSSFPLVCTKGTTVSTGVCKLWVPAHIHRQLGLDKQTCSCLCSAFLCHKCLLIIQLCVPVSFLQKHYYTHFFWSSHGLRTKTMYALANFTKAQKR